MWNRIRIAPILTLGVAMLALSAVPRLRADEFDKKTVMTFSGPVEISGEALPAGTYVFKTLRDDRRIVEVMNSDEDQLIALFHTVGIIDPVLSGDTRVELSEGSAKGPEVVHAWFYPGDTLGWEFPAPRLK